jgi:4-hydroxy-4-methyl-2-oxoglutarate aldolase
MISKDKLTQLRDLGTATIYEAQGAKGAFDHGMKPLDPTVRLAGPALTVDVRPADNLMLHYAVLQALGRRPDAAGDEVGDCWVGHQRLRA